MSLRPYQQRAIADLQEGFAAGCRRQILMLATGAGKTRIAGELIQRGSQQGVRSVFIVERIELAKQAHRAFSALGIPTGLLQGENTLYRPTDQALVASIQTLAKRGAPPDCGLVLIDEAHILHGEHIKLLERWDSVPVVGLTATPLRKGLARLYDRLVKGPTIRDLIGQGFLVPLRAYGPTQDKIEAAIRGVGVTYSPVGTDFINAELSRALNRKELIGDVIQTWQAQAQGLPTLSFAVDIAHSKAIVDDFRSEGIPAEHIDSYTDDQARADSIDRFRKGQTLILSSVNVLGIGFDVPSAQCAILARPTLSLALHVQQLGRVMRISPGKDHAIVLDHAGNYARHGRPEDFDVEMLDDGEFGAKSTKRTSEELLPCSACGFMLERDRRECPACGHERTRHTDVTYTDGELVEIGSSETHQTTTEMQHAFYQQLRQIGIDRQYKYTWATAQFKQKFGRWPPRAWEWGATQTPELATLRWVKSQQIRWARRRASTTSAEPA